MHTIKNTIKEAIYSLLNFFLSSRGIKTKVNDREIRFPVRYFKYFPSSYEKENFDFLAEACKRGEIAVDIGAHIGLYTVVMSTLVGEEGKVFSFEPSPTTRKILDKTVSLNKVDNIVTISSEAISDKEGTSYFYISENNSDNSNTLVDYRKDRKTKGIEIKLITLDKLREGIRKKIDFIKIDAEGAELQVLKGAQQTFLIDKPKAILALHPNPIIAKGDSLEDIWDVLMSYKLDVKIGREKISKEDFCKRTDLFDVHLS
jgi:FkbM family methyltransferase